MPPVREGSEAENRCIKPCQKHVGFQQMLGRQVGFNKQLILIHSNGETIINKTCLMDGNGQTLLLFTGRWWFRSQFFIFHPFVRHSILDVINFSG